jgi:predicted Zn-ribbon and HTH transcriptional regulator
MPTITAAHALKDIIEALCHEIILHPEKKAQLSDQLTFFTKRIDREHNVFGRCWCALLLTFCSESLDAEILESSDFEDWDTFVQNLNEAKESILRKDATVPIPPTIADKDIQQENFAKFEDESIDEERSNMPIFNQDLKEIIKLCRVHQSLSFIRVLLSGTPVPVSGKNKNELAISKNEMINMKKFIDKKFGKDMEEHDFLCSLFERNKLKSIPQLTEILETHKQYTIEYFLKLMERLLQSWYKVIMVEPPTLISSGYFYGRSTVVPPKSPRKRKSTHRFAEPFATVSNGNADTQEESAKKMPALPTENIEFEQENDNGDVASAAANFAVGSMVVAIDSADDDGDEDISTTGEGKPLKLPSTPPRIEMKAIDPPTKTSTSSPTKKRKRVRWTVEEKNAVRRGVSKFGEGNWKNVKLEYPVILAHRTNVQIKDCWRVMVKKGDTSLEVEMPGTL